MRRMPLLLGVAAVAMVFARAGMSRDTAAPTLTVKSSAFGRVLFDGRGYVLYAFTHDGKGRSVCYGACARAWPVYYAKGALRAGTGVRRSLLGTIRRRDGRRQITYGGRPLYYYDCDNKAGQIRCQNAVEYGGTWLVVRPSGRLVR